MDDGWNLWHGCRKISPGCENCYVYRHDGKYGIDSSIVKKNRDFDKPVRKNRAGEYKVKSGELLYTCFTSDFFLDSADGFRDEAWEMIKARSDVKFLFITKRITRFYECIPKDWGSGYDNCIIGCTCENRGMAEARLPIFLQAPIKHKFIVCEPLLEYVDLREYLDKSIEFVIVGGESGLDARVCDFDWVLKMSRDCAEKSIPFRFKQTGYNFIKDGKNYKIARKYQHSQAKKAGLDTYLQ